MMRAPAMVLVALSLAMGAAVSAISVGPEDSPGPIVFDTARGVPCAVVADGHSDLIAISAAVRVRDAELRARPGVGGVVLRAIFGDGDNLSSDGMLRVIHRVGGRVDLSWSPDCATITIVTAPTMLRDAVWVLAQALKNAEMDGPTSSRALRELLALGARTAADPLNVAVDAVRARMYGADIYGRGETVARDGLAGLRRDELLAYYRTAFRPTATAIAVVGDITLDQVRSTLENNLIDYEDRSGTRPGRLVAGDRPERTGPSRTDVVSGVSSAAVAVGYEGPGIGDPLYPSFRVMAALLVEGKGSRLFRTLRDTQGIGYVVGGEVMPEIDTSTLLAYAEFDPSREDAPDPAAVERTIVEAVEGLLSTPPSESEITRATRLVVGRRMLDRTRVSDRAASLARSRIMLGSFDAEARLDQALLKVTGDDVVDAARRFLTKRCVATVRPQVGVGRSGALRTTESEPTVSP